MNISVLITVLVIAAVALVVIGLMRRLIVLAFFGAAVGLAVLAAWPTLSSL